MRRARHRADRAAIPGSGPGNSARCSSRAQPRRTGQRLAPHRPDRRRLHGHSRMIESRERHLARRGVHPAGACKYVLWDNRRKSTVGELRIRDLCRRSSTARKRDRVDVCDVGAVERADIARISVVARPIDFPGSERKPADLRPDRARDIEPDTQPVKKADEGRCVDWRRHEAAGHPALTVTDKGPAPVM